MYLSGQAGAPQVNIAIITPNAKARPKSIPPRNLESRRMRPEFSNGCATNAAVWSRDLGASLPCLLALPATRVARLSAGLAATARAWCRGYIVSGRKWPVSFFRPGRTPVGATS